MARKVSFCFFLKYQSSCLLHKVVNIYQVGPTIDINLNNEQKPHHFGIHLLIFYDVDAKMDESFEYTMMSL